MKVSKWVSASIRFSSTIKKMKFNLFLTVFIFIVPKFKLKKISKKNNFFFFFWYQQQRKIRKKKKSGWSRSSPKIYLKYRILAKKNEATFK